MTNEQAERLIAALERIATALESSSPGAAGPRYTRPIAEYKNFNWASINAVAEKTDRYGAGVVRWQNHLYVRRSKDDFGGDVWYSRSVGKDDNGKSQYDVLIKFLAPVKVRSLSNDITDNF